MGYVITHTKTGWAMSTINEYGKNPLTLSCRDSGNQAERHLTEK